MSFSIYLSSFDCFLYFLNIELVNELFLGSFDWNVNYFLNCLDHWFLNISIDDLLNWFLHHSLQKYVNISLDWNINNSLSNFFFSLDDWLLNDSLEIRRQGLFNWSFDDLFDELSIVWTLGTSMTFSTIFSMVL